MHEAAKPISPKVTEAIQKAAKTLRKKAVSPRKAKTAKPQPKPKKLSQWKQTVHDQATAWGMPPEEYEKIVGELHREHAEHAGMREAAKLHARKVTGLTAADMNRLENQGYDHGSDMEETKGLDDIGRSLAAMYPSLGWGRGYDSEGGDDTDYGELLWNLIREGKQRAMSKRSPEFLAHVDDFLNAQMSSHGPVGTYDSHGAEHMVPFAKSGGLRIRYSKWLELRTRYERWNKRGAFSENRGWFSPKGGGSDDAPERTKVKEFFEKQLANSWIDEELANKYRSFAETVIDEMTPESLKLWSENVEHVEFYEDCQQLTTELGEQALTYGKYDPQTKTLHLDGDTKLSRAIEWDTAGIYALMFGQAVDGPQRKFSGTAEWNYIWKNEIENSVYNLSPYSRVDPSYGFGEMFRMSILGTRTKGGEKWRMATQFLIDNHLL